MKIIEHLLDLEGEEFLDKLARELARRGYGKTREKSTLILSYERFSTGAVKLSGHIDGKQVFYRLFRNYMYADQEVRIYVLGPLLDNGWVHVQEGKRKIDSADVNTFTLEDPDWQKNQAIKEIKLWAHFNG